MNLLCERASFRRCTIWRMNGLTVTHLSHIAYFSFHIHFEISESHCSWHRPCHTGIDQFQKNPHIVLVDRENCPPPCVMCLERCGAPCLQNFVWCRRSGNLLQQTKDLVQICLMDHQWSCTPHPRSEQYPRSLLLAAAQLENVSRQKHSTSYTSKGLKSSPQ